MLERQPGHSRLSARAAVDSIRLAAAAPDRYVVTSIVGNFLVGRRESLWLVVSLPGD
jgi:hypothetical protein